MERDEFAAWLIEQGFEEEFRGYGRVTGDTIADALYDLGFRIVLDG